MMNINSILKEYPNGDFETRLSLFLNYRDFRNEFIGIEAASDKLIKEAAYREEKICYCPIPNISAN